MVLEFIFLFGRFNLALLHPEKEQKVIEKSDLIHTESVEIVEYGKNNDRY